MLIIYIIALVPVKSSPAQTCRAMNATLVVLIRNILPSILTIDELEYSTSDITNLIVNFPGVQLSMDQIDGYVYPILQQHVSSDVFLTISDKTDMAIEVMNDMCKRV